MRIWELESAAKERECGGAAWNMVMSAIENANQQTGAYDGDEFEESARGTLESNLCYDNDCSCADLEWFRSVGVRW